MASSRGRTAFVVGALVGAAAGAAVAFWNAPQSGRSTRTKIQQSVEGVLFKALDMNPFQATGEDRVAADLAGSTSRAINQQPPVDVVIGSRPSEMSPG
jgi:gas vesicle protein